MVLAVFDIVLVTQVVTGDRNFSYKRQLYNLDIYLGEKREKVGSPHLI